MSKDTNGVTLFPLAVAKEVANGKERRPRLSLGKLVIPSHHSHVVWPY